MTARTTEHVTGCKLIAIGYWWSEHHTQLPRAADFVDASWDEDERFEVIVHLQHAMVARAYMGPSRCRFCGVLNGTLDLTDGTYVWPEGLAHYVREHHVRLPQELVDHVRACSARWEDAEHSHDWWRGLAKSRG
jgi:hypothetical protein